MSSADKWVLHGELRRVLTKRPVQKEPKLQKESGARKEGRLCSGGGWAADLTSFPSTCSTVGRPLVRVLSEFPPRLGEWSDEGHNTREREWRWREGLLPIGHVPGRRVEGRAAARAGAPRVVGPADSYTWTDAIGFKGNIRWWSSCEVGVHLAPFLSPLAPSFFCDFVCLTSQKMLLHF